MTEVIDAAVSPACSIAIGLGMDSLAASFCWKTFEYILGATGVNMYDVREPCLTPPACYDFSQYGDFLRRFDVRKALGVSHVDNYEECSGVVYANMQVDIVMDYTKDLDYIV
jgi:hypothetical protein